MSRNRRKQKKRHLTAPIAAAGLLALLLMLYPVFDFGGDDASADEQTAVPAETALISEESPLPPEIEAEEPAEEEPAVSEALGRIRISELMVKNHATLMDELGGFPDWVELENCSDEVISLEGFRIAEEPGGSGWGFGDVSLAPGEFMLVYTDGKSMKSPVVHADFSLSKGERVYLYDSYGLEVDSADCACSEADISLERRADGGFYETMYPSPGFPNGEAGYILRQQSLSTPSPLIISELMVYNNTLLRQNGPSNTSVYCDWVELRNVSDSSVELSDYYLSDDEDLPTLWQLPRCSLGAGERFVVLCAKADELVSPTLPVTDFELSSDGEQLFLSRADGSTADFVFIPDVPYGCSFGRVEGEKGWFYIPAPTPGKGGERGERLFSETPSVLSPDGVFEGVESVRVELSGPGAIRYTLDGSLPTEASPLYESPIELTRAAVIRARCFEPGKLPGRTLDLSYIINEGHSLPVLSLVSDSPEDFRNMYNNRRKELELPGALAFYEAGGGFALGCGIEMHGQTSLEMPKKNMSVRFRAAYGQAELDYDVFGGGVTEFTNFVLRSGQDFPHTIVRNELLQNLGLQMGDEMLNQRSRHCVLYINGVYSGLYTLTEKQNENHYARRAIVSRDSVTVVKAPVSSRSDFYELIRFGQSHDLSREDNYERFCRMIDIDSLIDWMIIEGYSANTDIADSNVRFCRSDENDGRWRLMLYDMDATLSPSVPPFANVLRPSANQCSDFIMPLLKNEEFRDRFLRRAGEVFSTVLSNENVAAELDRLCALVAPEVARDYVRFGRSPLLWEDEVSVLRRDILQGDRRGKCVDAICSYLVLSGSERAEYFGF